MLRYLFLYASFVRFSLSLALEFRVDFVFRVAMDLVYYAVNIAFYDVVYRHTDMLGGWTKEQGMVFVGVFITVDALVMTVFANNLWWLPHYVNRGELDYYLIRPVSSLFFLSLRQFAAESTVNLACALGILAYFLYASSIPIGIGSLTVLGICLVAGAVLYYLVHLCFTLPVFWMHSSEGLMAAFYNAARFMERPERMFSGWVRMALLTVLPFGLMASYPARLFLDGFDWRLLAHLFLATFAFGGLVLVMWKAGLHSYASASS